MSKQFIIIAGTNKAATSSIFEFLSTDSRISASKTKETRYFLDPDYPLAQRSTYEYDGTEKGYLRNFHCGDMGALYCESSPDYMYSPGTANRIADSLGAANVKLVFVLRDPVARFYSFYNYHKQIGNISPATTLEEYLSRNISDSSKAYAYTALETGKYSKYIRPFLSVFPNNSICVLGYEDLARNQVNFLECLYEFIGIDNMRTDSMGTVNKTSKVKFQPLDIIYRVAQKNVRPLLYRDGIVGSVSVPLIKYMAKYYKKINYSTLKEKNVDWNSFVVDYYRDDLKTLNALVPADITSHWLSNA